MKRQSQSNTSLVLQNLDEHLTCCVCMGEYTNPRVLPCIHTFCHPCIERLPIQKDGEGNDSIVCPICRKECCFRYKRRSQLPRAFLINNLLKLKEDLIKIKQTREKCEKHREHIKFYCHICQEAICLECATFEHKDHNYTQIETAYEQHQGDVRNQMEELEKKIEIFKDKAAKLSTAHSELEKKGDDITTQIKQQTKEMIDKLLSNEKRLVKEVEEAVEQKAKNLISQKETVEKVLEELVTCSEMTESSLMEWSQAKFLGEKSNIIDRIKAITEEIDPELFQPLESTDIALLAPVLSSLGKIQYSTCTSKALVIKPVTIEQQSHATLTLKSQNNKPFALPYATALVRAKVQNSKDCAPVPVSVVQTHTGEYRLYFTLTMRGLYSISVSVGGVELKGSPFDVPIINSRDTINCSITTINKVKSPGAISAFDDDSIVVADCADQSLVLFDQKGKLLNRISNKEEGFCPRGITVSLDQHILLTNGNRVLKLSREGTRVAVFGFKDSGKAFSHLDHPTGIAVNPITGDVLVIDSKNNRVQQMKSNLTHPRTIIGDPGKKCFNEPSDIVFDSNGEFIYIADYKNNAIKKFTSGGEFHSRIGYRGRKSGPMYLSIHNQDLYVCDNSNKDIKIFDLNGKFLACFASSTSGGIFGVAINHRGHILVSDSKSGKIIVY